MNEAWHQSHHALIGDFDARLAWYLEHDKECGCTPMPEEYRQAALRARLLRNGPPRSPL
jgi:hypothetical protein